MQLPDMPTFQAGLFVPSYKAMRQGAGNYGSAA
jgi:hypothetical protein